MKSNDIQAPNGRHNGSDASPFQGSGGSVGIHVPRALAALPWAFLFRPLPSKLRNNAAPKRAAQAFCSLAERSRRHDRPGLRNSRVSPGRVDHEADLLRSLAFVVGNGDGFKHVLTLIELVTGQRS